jgi:hypothetical protein
MPGTPASAKPRKGSLPKTLARAAREIAEMPPLRAFAATVCCSSARAGMPPRNLVCRLHLQGGTVPASHRLLRWNAFRKMVNRKARYRVTSKARRLKFLHRQVSGRQQVVEAAEAQELPRVRSFSALTARYRVAPEGQGATDHSLKCKINETDTLRAPI